ncbi:MAG: FAD-dependent oxidoreductase [Leptolyngbyaceae cyanobacterium bins.59]|nr:FAD-dependent oxidoreductase [Leptolyngbyaceae cyanobacterium bins.59]
MTYDYDLFIIGAGPGGHAAAVRAAKYGAKVAIVEQNAVGGACVNRGCVPMEMIDSAVGFATMYEDAANYGWVVNGSADAPRHRFDWSRFSEIKDREIARLNEVHTRSMTDGGVAFFRGQGKLVDAHTIAMDDRTVTADRILIAVGAKPLLPDNIQGIEHAITSRETFSLKEQPRRLAVVGGGYIGSGFASGFRGLGSEVTLINHEALILSGWDQEVCQMLQANFEQAGIKVLGESQVERIEPIANGLRVTVAGKFNASLEVDTVICAIGRVPCTEALGLEQAGVNVLEKGLIAVDGWNRTSQPHIFAIGDCTSKIALTPIATAQGRAFADTQFGDQPHQVDCHFIPAYIAARPQLAMVGMTEEEAKERFGEDAQCYRKRFEPLFYKMTRRDAHTLMKLVVNRGDHNRILGAHMVGDHAAEIIQSLAVAIRMGATKRDLNTMLGIHPTIAEEFFTL